MCDTKMIKQYITRGKKNNKQGLLVAYSVADDVHIGYSLCSKKDEFDKAFAHIISIDRAIVWNKKVEITIPHSIRKEFYKFIGKCSRYFKNKNLPVWAVENKIVYKK